MLFDFPLVRELAKPFELSFEVVSDSFRLCALDKVCQPSRAGHKLVRFPRKLH